MKPIYSENKNIDPFNYYYGMKFRPHTLGDCPSGFLHILDSDEIKTVDYYFVVAYNRKLTDKEIDRYELTLINDLRDIFGY